MKFITYLEEKIFEIIFQIFFLFILVFLLYSFHIHSFYIAIVSAIYLIGQLAFFWWTYWKKCREYKKIIEKVDSLEETYYITELLTKPKELQNRGYYYALKKACKAMNDKITLLSTEQLEYQEYVESFAHEIKVPIGALSLTFDNMNNHVLKKETDKIFQLVEQMLYYARSENTEKDYFVKELILEEVMHTVILTFRQMLLDENIVLQLHDLKHVVYTDEKWLVFILSQVVQNAIKYFDTNEKMLMIYSVDHANAVSLIIEDNGCGISEHDIGRVFEKGFTGSDRKKARSTGMGLYLSKKLCDRLGLRIEVASKKHTYTRVTIRFPKGKMHLLTS